jgi:curved DNA-binding protein CbpA
MPPPGVSHYQLLQLPMGATAEELRRAFRRLSKQVHPDTTSLPAAEAEQAFQRLQQAYAVLSDPEARRRYDAQLRLAALAAAAAAHSRASAAAVAGRIDVQPPLATPDSARRALSGGEWLALLLLALALVFSLVLGVGLAWARGAALTQWPSWWPPA